MKDEILNDSRTIISVWSLDAEEMTGARVGWQGTTRIEAYGEPGQECFVPWFAAYKNDESGNEYLWKRFNGAHMAQVEYAP